MAAGSIILDLLLKTGSFVTDTKRAEAALRKFGTGASDVAKIAAASFTAVRTASLFMVDQLIKGAADYADLADATGAGAAALASYAVAATTADVSMDSVGGAMNKLTKGLVGVDDESKAAGAALKALGLDIDTFKKLDPTEQYEAVAKALGKYADGAGKVAVAMALFGKSGADQLKVFKTLEDQGGRTIILTQEQIEQADTYADAQAKATIELKLYAQAAATQMAPAMTDLTNVAIDLIKQLIGVDSATGKLGKSTAIGDFADEAAKHLADLIDYARIVARAFQYVGKSIGITAAIAAAASSGSSKGAKAAFTFDPSGLLDVAGEQARMVGSIIKDAREQGEAEFGEFESFADKVQARINARKVKASIDAIQTDPTELARRGRGPEPELKFDGGKADKEAEDARKKGAAAAKAASDAAHKQAQQYIDDLKKQFEKTQDLTHAEQLRVDVAAGRVKFSSDAQKREAEIAAKKLDMYEAEKLKLDELSLTHEAVISGRLKSADAAANEAETLEQANEALRQEIPLIGKDTDALLALEQARIASEIATKEATLATLEFGGVTTKESDAIRLQIEALKERSDLLGQQNTAEKIADDLKRIDDLTKATTEDIYGMFEDGLAQGLTGTFDGILKSWGDMLLQMVQKAIAMDLMSALTDGASGKGGNTGALWGGLAKVAGSFFGGSSGSTGVGSIGNAGMGDYKAYFDSLPKMATGTDYVPRDMLAMVHEGERITPKAFNPAAGNGGAPSVQIINNGAPATATVTNERGPDGKQTIKILMDAIKQDIAAGGQVGKSIESQYGLRRALPRRG